MHSDRVRSLFDGTELGCPLGAAIRQSFAVGLMAFIPVLSWAGTTICEPESRLSGIRAIAWDDETRAAKVTDLVGDSHEGRASLIREHAPYGSKVNIFVKYAEPRFGEDAAEWVVFPVGPSDFRVIGVGYVLRDGKYYLSTSEGNRSAVCLSIE